ncbi:recombinase family protein [Bacillus coahuilensis]|uniref:recombinase family protein n=1 Tax=Bacillus coahuilensis TaxID=408580 RepID=UPI002351C76A|nr:recombinase family protein [Bacillus coahuilensis]
MRTASKNNTDHHLNIQSEQLKQFISNRNWQLYNSYIDIGSGPNKYKNLQEIVNDAQNNKFDIILSTDPTRLFRNPKLSAKLKKLCEIGAIQIMTLNGTINTLQGNVDIFSLYAWIVEQESTNLSERIKYGKKKHLLEKQS